MRTIIYIDGFNLYHRLLKDNPRYKWLNLRTLAGELLQPQTQIQAVRYYTGRISGRFDLAAPARQQVYLDALKTVPEITVHLGISSSPSHGPGWCILPNCVGATCRISPLLFQMLPRSGKPKKKVAM
jgi:hypothetical protein